MNRKFLLAPLIAASMTAFSAQADNALGLQALGSRSSDNNALSALRANRANAVSASRADSLTSVRANLRERITDRAEARADARENRADNSRVRELFDGDRLDNARDAARDRRDNARERREERREDRRSLGRDVAVLNAAGDNEALRDRLEARRASLPGLEEADASALRDRFPKVTTDSDRDGDTRTRSLKVEGQNGEFKLTNVVEAKRPDASDRNSGERSLDRTLNIENTIEGSRQSGDNGVAQRDTNSSFKRTSSMNFERNGEIRSRTEDSPRSRSVENRLAMNSAGESSFKSDGSGSNSRDIDRSNRNNFGFTRTSSSERSGLQRAERSRDIDYDLDFGNRGS